MMRGSEVLHAPAVGALHLQIHSQLGSWRTNGVKDSLQHHGRSGAGACAAVPI